ncbi:MAG: hypothetical protein A4E72_01296 [Syntrophus sp. PtaU1.Bin208]|nr:MAG: hypothetical protein A4E72_01296 [Syntrophus sp. PtaU1.Bin208]
MMALVHAKMRLAAGMLHDDMRVGCPLGIGGIRNVHVVIAVGRYVERVNGAGGFSGICIHEPVGARRKGVGAAGNGAGKHAEPRQGTVGEKGWITDFPVLPAFGGFLAVVVVHDDHARRGVDFTKRHHMRTCGQKAGHQKLADVLGIGKIFHHTLAVAALGGPSGPGPVPAVPRTQIHALSPQRARGIGHPGLAVLPGPHARHDGTDPGAGNFPLAGRHRRQTQGAPDFLAGQFTILSGRKRCGRFCKSQGKRQKKQPNPRVAHEAPS